MDFRSKVSILFSICLLTRLCFVGRYLDSCDSIDFALGLHDYDLSLLQPHFPGYPVYMVASSLFFKLSHQDVWSLAMPGVLFGSITVYPLSLLTRQLFSERVAILTAVLYLINPLCWLQAERPTSDAMGLFFVISAAYLLYCAFKLKVLLRAPASKAAEKADINLTTRCISKRYGRLSDRNYLFLGSLFLGFGLGVRLSYFPFIAFWMGILLYLAIQKMRFFKDVILYGMMGFVIGVCVWFLPQISYVGRHPFWGNCLSFSRGHFTDWGGSVITFGGLGRVTCLVKSIWVYGLGGWWNDASFLRLAASLIMIVTFLYSFKRYQFDRRGFFLGLYVIPYMLWVILGQNVANPRHIMPILPVVLMLIAYGLCKTYEEMNKGISIILTVAFVVSMSVISFRLVLRYHNNVPAPIQLIQFIEKQFDCLSTKIYCGGEKRFFDYYAPQWDVRSIEDVTGLGIDLKSSLYKPQNILIVRALRKIEEFEANNPPIITFEANPYTDDTKEGLLLYKWNGL